EISSSTKFLADFKDVILRSIERSRNRVLLRMISAQARTQQLVDTIHVRPDHSCVTADYCPSDAPTWSQIVLRQSSEGDNKNVKSDNCKGDVLIIFENELVIDFVDEDHQVILPCQFGDVFQHSACADRSCR